MDQTLDEAIPVLSDLGPDDLKESNSLMQILDNNMDVWTDSSEFAGNIYWSLLFFSEFLVLMNLFCFFLL